VRWNAKVANSLTDVWQQLFLQQDITVICIIHFFTPGCMKTTPLRQSLETPTESDTQEYFYQKPCSEGRQ